MSITATETPAAPVIREAGVYDIPAEVYHRDPVAGGSLSSSGARRLLPPSCPAKFRHELDNPRPRTAAMELGHAAHRLVLGAGHDIVVVDADSYRTNAAKDERDDARAAGKIALLPDEFDVVTEMAAVIAAHPVASKLFAPGAGDPERVLVWPDDETGIWRRAMLDWLPHPTGRRMIVTDYKTTAAADLDSVSKSIQAFGYHQQAAWYLDGVRALGLDADPAFIFVVQEKTPPYLVQVVQLDLMAERIGRARNRRAINLYAECVKTGRWPGYSDAVELVSLPVWAERNDSEEYL